MRNKNCYGKFYPRRTGLKNSFYRLNNPNVQPVESEDLDMYPTDVKTVYISEEEMHKEKSSGIEVDENNVYFYSEINSRSALELIRIIRKLDIELGYLSLRMGLDKNPPIKLHISSPGGCLYSTLNICDEIDSCKTEVHTYVEGFAASGATVIAAHGKKRFMNKNALMLIHQPALNFWSGKHDEFEDEVKNQSIAYDKVKNAYLNVSKISAEDLSDLMKHELHLTADKCLEYGFIDKII